MHVTATQAKNRFGYVCAQAKSAPVFVEKDGRLDSVILSAETYESLQATAATRQAREKQAAFDDQFAEWLNEQQGRFDAHGVWCDDLRVW